MLSQTRTKQKVSSALQFWFTSDCMGALLQTSTFWKFWASLLIKNRTPKKQTQNNFPDTEVITSSFHKPPNCWDSPKKSCIYMEFLHFHCRSLNNSIIRRQVSKSGIKTLKHNAGYNLIKLYIKKKKAKLLAQKTQSCFTSSPSVASFSSPWLVNSYEMNWNACLKVHFVDPIWQNKSYWQKVK